jgi:hypothetical protein
MKVMHGHLLMGVALTLLSAQLPAAGIVDAQVEGNTLKASLDAGAASAELTVRFDNVVGLSAESLGLSLAVVSPLDPTLLSRLGSNSVRPASAFPVLLRIDPPATGGLSFSGTVTVELYTHNLQYEADTPLRLFSAPTGGAFVDVTSFMGSGSYRTGARKGTFSEFLIVADSRGLDAVVSEKFARVDALLDAYGSQISAPLSGDLAGLLAAAHTAYETDATVAAIQYLESFAATVVERGGDGIPNVWQSSRELTNVAGELHAAADTLRFSLTIASNNN